MAFSLPAFELHPIAPAALTLLAEVRACTRCAAVLPLGPRPVLQLDPAARILIASQAPGRAVHASGIPFDDASGERLRDWLGVTCLQFYDPRLFAIVPMGLCYPGKGKAGDLPPRPECAPRWRAPLLQQLGRLQLTLAIGRYAMAYHLPQSPGSLTEAVQRVQTQAVLPAVVALPHPSPANNRWLARNRWFEQDMVPRLRERVAEVLQA